jgi:hypothetical protein
MFVDARKAINPSSDFISSISDPIARSLQEKSLQVSARRTAYILCGQASPTSIALRSFRASLDRPMMGFS